MVGRKDGVGRKSGVKGRMASIEGWCRKNKRKERAEGEGKEKVREFIR